VASVKIKLKVHATQHHRRKRPAPAHWRAIANVGYLFGLALYLGVLFLLGTVSVGVTWKVVFVLFLNVFLLSYLPFVVVGWLVDFIIVLFVLSLSVCCLTHTNNFPARTCIYRHILGVDPSSASTGMCWNQLTR